MKILVCVALISVSSLGCRKDKGDKVAVQKALAFVVQKNSSTANLWYIAADGTSFSEVINDNLGTAVNNPTWAADGRRIFFIKSSENKGENGIFSVRPNGSELTIVYKDNADQLRKYYQLCADNKEDNVVFSLDIPRADRRVIELYTMCPCGDRVVRLTQFETSETSPMSTEAYAGSFSPGDSLLAFVQSNPDILGKRDAKIYTINILTKEIKLIKTFKTSDPAAAAPSFSPNGKQFLLSIDGVIHTMGADGSDLKPLSNLKGFHPTWDKNGTDFYFSSYGIPDMEQGIYQCNISVTNIKRITRSPAIGIHGGFAVNL